MFYSKLRVDILSSSVKTSVLSILENHCSAYAWVEESPDSHPHIHCYLEHNQTTQYIRSLLRNIGLSGNKDYSLATLDCQYPIEYLGYLCKEGTLFSSNIPGNVLDEAEAYMQRVKSEIKAKKECKKTILDKIVATIPQEYLDDTYSYSERIQDAIIKYHLDNKLLIRKYQCQAYYETIICRTQSLNHARCLIFDKILR